MLKHAKTAYKTFQYHAVRYWAERVLNHENTTKPQKLEATIWAGAAAYLTGETETARRFFRQAHESAAKPVLSTEWFPAHMIEFFQDAGQGPATDEGGR